jgi:hypothetical protein
MANDKKQPVENDSSEQEKPEAPDPQNQQSQTRGLSQSGHREGPGRKPLFRS